MDWTNPRISESAEEEEAKMFGLVSSFSTKMRKRAARAQGETNLNTEASGGKRPQLIGLDEEAQKSLTVINVDSLERAFNAQSALEDTPYGASKKACTLPESGIPTKGSPGVERAVAKASLEVAAALSSLSRLASVGPHRPRNV